MLLLLCQNTGCAVHYYDPETGTEHLWGFGHMRMRVPPPHEGVRAVVHGNQELGAGLNLGQLDYGVSVGWHNSRRLDVLEENASVFLEWPRHSFFHVRVGTNLPPDMKTNNLPGNNQIK
jgi:hypothetical protein